MLGSKTIAALHVRGELDCQYKVGSMCVHSVCLYMLVCVFMCVKEKETHREM